MEFSFTSFILEIVNFLVLVWILKRLFFIPIKKGIDARKAGIAKTLEDAKKVKDEAEKQKVEYEKHLHDWETEKDKAQDDLKKSLDEEKAKGLKNIESSLAEEREKLRLKDEQKRAELKSKMEREVMKQGSDFASRFLSGLACPELEAKIINLTLDRIKSLEWVTGPAAKTDAPYLVHTAFVLSEDQKNTIRNTIKDKLKSDHEIQFHEERSLISGLEILIGSHIIRANLRDELSYFSELQ